MKIHRNINELPPFKNAAVTIGTFDGVHLGHQEIISQLKKEAEKINGETVIITFHPHPRKIITPQKTIFVLNTFQEKIALLDARGIHHLVIVHFDEAFSNQSPEIYIKNFLFSKFHPHTVIIGYDHRFGKNRQGDYHLLESYAAELGFIIKEIPEQVINKIIISSTKIREALLSGEIAIANKYLGYDYFFEGTVIHGDKLGRTLGYPTANILVQDEEKLIPANGVYAVEAEFFTKQYTIRNETQNEKRETRNEKPLLSNIQLHKGMMNIGIRPTIGGTKRMIEVNIFNFDKDIYGQTMRVYVKHYLRPETKFDGLEALAKQIARDKIEAEKILQD
ncbi:MAG: bifunctional riboflavin kinase/FAD synthetase [Parafilimonas sp.]